MARVHGTVTKWNDERGFGFITLVPATQGGAEIFVHVSAFPRDGRRPTIGDPVSFEVGAGSDGKQRATHVRRAGRRPVPGPRRSWLPAVLALAAVAIAVAYIRTPEALPAKEYVAAPLPLPSEAAPAPQPVAAPAAPIPHVERASFSCDGRTRCTQMNSCAEARYFLKHCPGTQMDGDHDGIPCEQQWCR